MIMQPKRAWEWMWNCVLETNEKQTNQSKFESFKKSLPKRTLFFLARCERPRVAWSAESGEGASSIAKDLIDRKDLEQAVLSRLTRFFRFAISYWQSFELVGYRQNRIAIDRHGIFHKWHKWHLCKMFCGWGQTFKNQREKLTIW